MMLVTAKCEVLQADVMLRTVANKDSFAQGCTKFRARLLSDRVLYGCA
jgi:hypothetical protein